MLFADRPEIVGTGTVDMIRRCIEAGLREPEFDLGTGFLIRIWRAGDRKTTQDATLPKRQPETTENRQKTARNKGQSPEPPSLSDRILALLRQNPFAGRREIAATLGTTRSIVRYRLDKLRAAGKIERVGPDKGGYWKVLGESAVEPDPIPERDAG